jgi:hypothetical protein
MGVTLPSRCMLTGINGNGTGSGHLEVHCLYAATNFQTRLDVATPWAYINTSTTWLPNRLPMGGSAPPLVTTASLREGEGGARYSAALTALNGSLPYNWSLLAGSLPPVLSLSGSGLLSGTPAKPGTYSFTVQVMGIGGAPATKAFALTIAKPVTVSTAKISFKPTSRKSSHALVGSAGPRSQGSAEHPARWHRFSAPTGGIRAAQYGGRAQVPGLGAAESGA